MEKQMNPVKPEQLQALKYLILHSKDAGPETKKALFALIDASEGLTKSVCYTGHSQDITEGIENVLCCQHATHLSTIMTLIGTSFDFSHHDGYFAKLGKFKIEIKPFKRYTHTIWLSPESYDKKAVEISEKQVDRVQLIDPFTRTNRKLVNV